MKVEVGQLWKVTTDNFYTSGERHKLKRPVNIQKDEIIEIRFPYAWHFRTIDAEYFHCTEEMLKENAEPYGMIYEEVRFNNRASLKEIVDIGLYNNIQKQ